MACWVEPPFSVGERFVEDREQLLEGESDLWRFSHPPIVRVSNIDFVGSIEC